ncbi:MAG: response regulator [Nitrospirae bacterium]|nr:response regulator [Nitrospirota bacterium]MCL5977993.1 response regulator [Nitrospirota bacterium]
MDEEIKILCVDDEQNVLNALKRLFIDEPYEIFTAISGQDGLKILEQENVNLVISDYRMPGMNGVEFLREVYRSWPDTVRIVLSGYADTAAIVSAINEGHIYKFIPKPWNDDDLKVTISNAIERYSLLKKNRELSAELRKKNKELEKLLEEKSAHLEFRSKALSIQQNILNAIPAGIVGIDFNDMVVLCNSIWVDITQSGWKLLGQDAKYNFPADVVEFIEDVKNKNKAAKKLEISGVYGKLSGAVMNYSEDQKGVILVFSPENEAV